MPIIPRSSYAPPMFLRNTHAQTLLPVALRPRPIVRYQRNRLELPDNDFIDIDVAFANPSKQPGRRVAIISHGLEGNSEKKYMLGMARSFLLSGWDVIARNFRGCSGEINRLPTLYCSGDTDDLGHVVRWALKHNYEQIILVGFSMGGSQTIKYLGEQGTEVSSAICGSVVFSVPCDLESTAEKLDKPSNRIYLTHFMRSLKSKLCEKAVLYPEIIDVQGLDSIKHFTTLDERYTAPMYGFRSARDYWQRSSCLPYLSDIHVPTLLVNAADDPFLAPKSFPYEEAHKHPYVTLEVPKHGGHVGFIAVNRQNRFWSESRAVEFAHSIALRR